MLALHKEGASHRIVSDAWKPEVERFVPPRVVAIGIRRIGERDPRRQVAGRAVEVKSVREHFAVRKCLRVIGARNPDRVRNYGSVRRENGCQEDDESHDANVMDGPPSRRGCFTGGRPTPQMDCKPATRSTT